MKLDEKKIKKLSSNLSTPLSEISYVLLAYALFTDGNVSEEENQAAIQITLDLGNDWNYEQEDIVSAYREATEVCNGASKEELQAVFIDVLAKLDHQEDFKLAQRKRLIGYLESIMDADGVQHKNEIFYIGKIKELLKLEEGKALEKLGTTKKDLAERVLKNIAVSTKNPEAYAFVKSVSSKNADFNKIKEQLENGMDKFIDFADDGGYTAMHYACWDNKLLIVELLIDFGANPNVLSPTNETPLNMAVVSGHFDIVQFFVDYDVEMELNIEWEKRNTDPNPMSPEKGSTLIRDALLNQHWDIFDLLINGIAPNLDVLTEPCSVGFEGETNFFLAIKKLYQSKNIDYDKERLETIRSTVEGSSNQETNNEERTVSDENRSTLDRITFFLLSFAQNDGIVKEEIQEVASIIESLLGDSFSFDKFKTGADWFQEEMEKVEWNREDKGLKAILKECIAVVEDFFGKSEPPAKRLFINQVIGIANVDGQVGKSEIDWIERLCKGIDIEIPNILDEDPERRWDVEEEDDDKGYPMITVRVFKDKDGNDDPETQKLVKEYMMNWHEPTEEYNGRMGITARIPDFFAKINAHCPKWTSDEITNIKNYITKYKVIPSLNYVMEDFDLFTKNVWWLAPFVFWNGNDGEIASWLFIDKNGFQAAHPSDNEGALIFNWDIITDVDTDWLEDNLVMLTLYGEHNGNDIELRFCEVVSEGNGSYLEVIESIHSIYEKTIEESRGSSTWSHGAGGEGYEGFDNPKELLDEKKWKAVEPTNPSLYGSSFEEIKTVDQKENGSNTKEITNEMLEDGYTGTGGFTFSDGGSYFGEWKDGMMHGTGNYSWVNGDIHMGEFKEGDINGQGELINLKSGKVTKGLWKNGVLVQSAKVQPPPVRFTKGPQDVRNRANESLLDQIREEENNDEVVLNLVRYFESNKMTEKESLLLTQQILEINKDAQVVAELARLLINAGQNKDFAVSLLKDKKEYTGDDFSFDVFDKIKAELGEFYQDEVEDMSKEITNKMLDDGYTGQGTYTFSDGAIYIGKFKDGNFHGQGTMTYPDGENYVGEHKDDLKHGQGTYTYADGENYVGEFKDGNMHGKGTYTYASGSKYVGEWKDDLKHGQGTYTFANGTIKEGLFENNEFLGPPETQKKEPKEDKKESQVKVTIEMMQQGFDGKGLFDAPDGSKYEGDFKAGRFSGKGKLIWPDGENYDGDWKDGNPNGKGIYNFTNGDVYDGEFKNGEKSGSGKFTHGPGDWEGDVYEGEWKNDQRSGHGVITFGSGEFKGEKYDGQWKDGKRNGKGTYDFADGTSFIGTWKDGECVEKEVELKTENKVLSKDSPIWEIIQHEFINLGKRTSVFKKEFSNLLLSKYPHIKKGTLQAQIAIQVINKRSRTNYNQCSKERVCGDDKFDFLFEQEDKTLCKYDKSKHGIWEIYKRDDGKLDVRIFSE